MVDTIEQYIAPEPSLQMKERENTYSRKSILRLSFEDTLSSNSTYDIGIECYISNL